MNRGVKIPIVKATDWKVKAGGTSQIPYNADCLDWSPFLPDYDNQFGVVDWQRCVSESYVHVVETRLNWSLVNKKFTQNQINELTQLGYIVNNRFKFSIRALAKMSGTDETGNSQNAVAECARTQGLLPDSDWASDPSMDWAAHYATIPANLLTKALQILNYVSLLYAWLVTDSNPVADYQSINQAILGEIQQSPLQFTCPLCPSYETRFTTLICATCDLTEVVHAMELYNLENDNGALNRQIRDSYAPYNITFRNNYPIPFILKIVATVLPDPTAPENTIVKETIVTADATISTMESIGFFDRVKAFLTSMGINWFQD